MENEIEDLKQSLRKKKTTSAVPIKDLLSSGSTLLNLACSGKSAGAFPKGSYIWFVGDSTSGKTWFALSCLAEASINKHFDGYRFVFDNGEGGALMDIEYYFGEKAAKRLEPPAWNGKVPLHSRTIEEFYYNVDDAMEQGPCLYIRDSMDSLTSEDEQSKYEDNKEAMRKGKEAKGSYGDGKAKKNSAGIRQLLPKLHETGSILFLISQTRDSLAGFGFGDKKTFSGGHALKFYATLQIWSSVMSHIKRTVRGKERELGVLSHTRIKKNRLTGRDRAVDIPILHSVGIDDLGACIDYLLEEKHWKKEGKGGVIQATDFDFVGTREALIDKIEAEEIEPDLRHIVAKVWNEIEEACAVNRKNRYQ